jgi:hypothetical protein
MFERYPKPSEIIFALALITMTTPAVNELIRSIRSNDTVARSCPPLLSEDKYREKQTELFNLLKIPTNGYPSFSMAREIPTSIQSQLDQLETSIKEARKNRTQIFAATSGPLKQKDADYIGFGSGIFAFITASIKEARKIKRI